MRPAWPSSITAQGCWRAEVLPISSGPFWMARSVTGPPGQRRPPGVCQSSAPAASPGCSITSARPTSTCPWRRPRGSTRHPGRPRIPGHVHPRHQPLGSSAQSPRAADDSEGLDARIARRLKPLGGRCGSWSIASSTRGFAMRQGDTPYLISPNAILLHDPDEKRSLRPPRYLLAPDKSGAHPNALTCRKSHRVRRWRAPEISCGI